MADSLSHDEVTISGYWSVTIPADRVAECPAIGTSSTSELVGPVMGAIRPAVLEVLDGLEITEADIKVGGHVSGGMCVTRTPDPVDPESES